MARFTMYLALTAFVLVTPVSAVIGDAVDAVGDAVQDAYDTTASWVDGAADTVSDTAEDVYNTTSSWVSDAADTVGSAVEDAHDTVASATGSIIDDVSSAHTLAVTSATIFAFIGLAAATL
ncbi:hypothetical protein L917_04268 [Phytophthora nicotianae]|uniref:Uncharacterized protein n=4 Tax=Phytophthora nicotianae TaxID=4792 RepID=W2QI34_PHYN3|nr:hypothetical protein PPTG_08857 [Phytophthora nicotianae INRA-310]ETI52270.1 hypothetical protein F443_04557 [Phytophthora nicotianae P1569]ETL98719.1 hypothetical protein L917_04268 [Phytophthora nicotianae]ETO81032.1 hypothetical protein F444_04587 [Phytophthora nicotianae P1976]KUF91503.1 Flavoprotein YCP4 [Phytophthora nicotianae]ETM51880.1 hypothetical protein L914_04374 [Phytophthora nicotianae]